MSNRLVTSTSPYLLQHASNPVDWFPWGDEALLKARQEDKPIFLSIGYSACHWCHVMAHESFEDPATAAIMNAHYVCIKVDREERPDLDGIYMDAVVALSGQGGWPMSVFLTPDLQPFYGGTYFPPLPRHGLPAFKDLLQALADAWKTRREEIIRVGGEVAAHLVQTSAPPAQSVPMDEASLASATRKLLEGYDWEYGGWGAAPKFPHPLAVDFLLRRHVSGDAGALEPALHALRMMARGGMYDVVGGGFARYSTDNSWRLPHFEKMLYDNALLASTYIHAWQITADPFFRRVAEETLQFVSRELTSPGGGFYSSLDADSEGEEGRFYTWSGNEIRAVLGDDAPFFELAYGIASSGDGEGRTVLQRAMQDAELSAATSIPLDGVSQRLAGCHAKLLDARSQRVRPATDDKVLTAWNGLMLAAFTEAARVFDQEKYLQIAARNAGFLLDQLRPQGRLCRAWRAGRTSPQVFLEDYAALILGLLELYQADFNQRWFTAACQLAGEMHAAFPDPAGGFFDTAGEAPDLLLRPRELQDNATPSGNALAAEALLKLSAFSEDNRWRTVAENTINLVAGMADRHPLAFGRWLSVADFALSRVKQVAIIGRHDDEETRALVRVVHAAWRPNLVLSVSSYPPPAGCPALLKDRPMLAGKPTAYVCEGFVCRQPVTTVDELEQALQV